MLSYKWMTTIRLLLFPLFNRIYVRKSDQGMIINKMIDFDITNQSKN